jgi:hypothetical protein
MGSRFIMHNIALTVRYDARNGKRWNPFHNAAPFATNETKTQPKKARYAVNGCLWLRYG